MNEGLLSILLEQALSRCVHVADLDHFNRVYKSIIDSIHEINDNLCQIQAPFFYLTLPSDGFTSPSVPKIADFKPTIITIK